MSREPAPMDAAWARTPPAVMVRSLLQAALVVPLTSVISPVRVVERETLRSIEPPVIWVANHQSHLDAPVVLTALGARLRRRLVIAAAADYFYRNALAGSAFSLAIGTVPFVRGNGSSRPSLELLKRLLGQGWSVLIFPSGSRGQDEVKKGFAFLAVDSGVPVVPLHLHGLKDSLPKGSFVPMPGGVVVGVGEPIPAGADYDSLVISVDEAFSALRRRVHDRIAGWGDTPPPED